MHNSFYAYDKNVKTTNFIDETIGVLRSNGKYEKDIYYVQVKDIATGNPVYVDWTSFKEAVKGYIYNRSYGIQYIWSNLKIVLYNGEYMIRNEYDGYEWWEYVSKPAMENLTILKYNPNEMEFKEWDPSL